MACLSFGLLLFLIRRICRTKEFVDLNSQYKGSKKKRRDSCYRKYTEKVRLYIPFQILIPVAQPLLCTMPHPHPNGLPSIPTPPATPEAAPEAAPPAADPALVAPP